MVSDMYRILLVTLVVVAFVEVGETCKSAPKRWNGITKADEWFCPPGNVVFMIAGVYRCFDTSPDCPNGALYHGECYCFPNTRRDRHGVCGKICSNCENGWCSSKFKCECDDGFTMSRGRCVPDPRSWEQPAIYPALPPPMMPQFIPQRHPHHVYSQSDPPQKNFGVPPGFYPRPYIQSYAPTTRPQLEPGFRPQSRPEFHSQSLPQSPKQLYPQTVFPSRLPAPRPEVKPVTPQAPSQLPSGSPSASRPEFIPASSAEIHPESTPERNPEHSTALRPYQFDNSDKPSQPSSQGHPEDERCTSEYEWDPRTRSCIRKERRYDPKIDLRAESFD